MSGGSRKNFPSFLIKAHLFNSNLCLFLSTPENQNISTVQQPTPHRKPNQKMGRMERQGEMHQQTIKLSQKLASSRVTSSIRARAAGCWWGTPHTRWETHGLVGSIKQTLCGHHSSGPRHIKIQTHPDAKGGYFSLRFLSALYEFSLNDFLCSFCEFGIFAWHKCFVNVHNWNASFLEFAFLKNLQSVKLAIRTCIKNK